MEEVHTLLDRRKEDQTTIGRLPSSVASSRRVSLSPYRCLVISFVLHPGMNVTITINTNICQRLKVTIQLLQFTRQRLALTGHPATPHAIELVSHFLFDATRRLATRCQGPWY